MLNYFIIAPNMGDVKRYWGYGFQTRVALK